MSVEENRGLMYRIVFELSPIFKKMIKEVKLEQIDIKNLNALCYLHGQKYVSMTDLSRGMGLPKSYITLIVNELVKESYVERKYDSDDRRIIYLDMTEKGKAYMAEKCAIVEELLAERVQLSLSEAEICELNESVVKVIDILRKLGD